MTTKDIVKKLNKNRPAIFDEEKKKAEKVVQPVQAPVETKSQIIRNQDTGKISGITTPSGETFLGSPKTVQEIAENQRQQFEAPAGTIEASQVAAEQQLREQGIAALEQAQNRPALNLPTDAQNVGLGQAALSGAAYIIPGAVGGAAVGGVAGAGAGAIPGAAVGAVAGFLTGVRSSIKQQIGEGITAKGDVKVLKSNLKKAITDINQGGNSPEDIAFFYDNLDQMRINQAQVKADSQTVWALAAGEDATLELERYEKFFRYQLPLLENELNQAVLNPNPSKILVDFEEQ